MERFDIDQFLRYLTIGIFFVFLNYCIVRTDEITDDIAVIGIDNLSVVLIGLCLLSGTLIYVIYRSFFYAYFFNRFVVWITNTRRVKELPVFKGKSIAEIILLIDSRRWRSSADTFKKLVEWSSQVHFLYTITLSCGIAATLSIFLPQFYEDASWLYLISAAFFLLSTLHHARLKYMEIEIVKQGKIMEDAPDQI